MKLSLYHCRQLGMHKRISMHVLLNCMTILKLFIPLLLSLCLTSCATTLNVQVQRPAEIDLNGSKTIAVLPFKTSQIKNRFDVVSFLADVFIFDYERCSSDEKRCIEKLKYEIEDGLAKSPYITLVHSAEVQKAIENNHTNPADVYLAGEVSDFHSKVTEQQVKRSVRQYIIDENGNRKEVTEYENVIEYSRKATFSLTYQVVGSTDANVLINSSVELSSQSGYFESKDALPSAYSLLQRSLEEAAQSILREIQPYTITKSLKLLKDKTKNPDMKKADSLAAESYFQESYDQFLHIYNTTGLFEAGYNAAILKEAMGDLGGAQEIMKELYLKTSDKRALKSINDIENEIYQAERLKSQVEATK